MKWKLPLLGMTLYAAAAHAGGLADTGFEAQYAVGLPNRIVANIAISVSRESSSGRGAILYRNATTPQGIFASLLSPPLATHSRIARVGGRLRPLEYEYRIANRPGRRQHVLFDWKRRRAAVEKEGETYELPFEDGTVDENTLQLQLVEDAGAGGAEPFDRTYRLLSNGKIKTRRFVGAGTETIETALGHFDTVRIERIRRGKTDRVLWLSPEHRYLPLRIEKLDDGRVRQRMSVRTLHIAAPG